MTFRILFFLSAISFSLSAQGIKVEYDKSHDFTKYKTFSFGEGEIVTPKDERVIPDEKLHKWIKGFVAEELKEKGLVQQDSAADLKVSYLIGSLERTDFERLGPLGTTPDNTSQTWSRDYWQSTLVIDLNERSGRRIWRVNATASSPSNQADRMIGQTVGEGFKKFSIKPKKEKKKK